LVQTVERSANGPPRVLLEHYLKQLRLPTIVVENVIPLNQHIHPDARFRT
jgi:hypothetical protein